MLAHAAEDEGGVVDAHRPPQAPRGSQQTAPVRRTVPAVRAESDDVSGGPTEGFLKRSRGNVLLRPIAKERFGFRRRSLRGRFQVP